MAAATGPKLLLPQIERIRKASTIDEANTHIADALSEIVRYVNQNTTPAAGNAVTPANNQNAKKQLRVKPLNTLR